MSIMYFRMTCSTLDLLNFLDNVLCLSIFTSSICTISLFISKIVVSHALSGSGGSTVLCDCMRVQCGRLCVWGEEDAAARLVLRCCSQRCCCTGIQTPLPQPSGRQHQVCVIVCLSLLFAGCA